MLVEHYTYEQDWKLKLITIARATSPDRPGLWIKPSGALYTSPVNSKYGWRHWTKDENFGLGVFRVELSVDMTHPYVKIDTLADMERLPWRKFSPPGTELNLYYVDYGKLVDQGIEFIWLTERGQSETRLTWPRNLYGWDCETVAILDTRCIKNWWMEDAPERARTGEAAAVKP